jgi:hypothetical protein
MKRAMAAAKFGVPSVPKASPALVAAAASLPSPHGIFGAAAVAVEEAPLAKKARGQPTDASAASDEEGASVASMGTPTAAAPDGVPPSPRTAVSADEDCSAPPPARAAAKSVSFAEVLEEFAPEAPREEAPAPAPLTVTEPEPQPEHVASPEPAASALDYSFFLSALEAAEQAATTLLENERGRADAHELRAADLASQLQKLEGDAAAAAEAARLEAERVAAEHAAALNEARAQTERSRKAEAAMRAAVAGANAATLAMQEAAAAVAAAVALAAQLAAA